MIGWLLILAWGPMVAVIAAGFPVPLWFTVLGWSLVPASIGLVYWSIRIADREDVHGDAGRAGGDDGADPC